MNHEEAIKELKERYELGKDDYMKDVPEYVEALGMGIEALKQQSVFEQVKWERDVAIAQLEENGLSLGEKSRKSEWIPITYHVVTDEERKRDCISDEIVYFLDCRMPGNEEEIIVCHKNGWINVDICYIDTECSLDSGWDWIEDVVAWMPLPEPYKGE